MFMGNKFHLATLTWRAFEKLSIDDRELPRDITWFLSFRICGTVYKWRKKCFRSYLPPPYPPKKFVTGPVYEKFQSYHITRDKLYRKKRKHHRTFPAEIMTRLRRPEKKSKINAEKFSRGIFWTQNRNLLHCWGWYVSCGDAHTSVKVCMHSGHNKEKILTFLWNPELFQIDISKHICSNNLPHPWPTDPKLLCRSQGLTDIQLTFWFKNAISLTFLRCLDFTWNGSLALSPCPHEMIKI